MRRSALEGHITAEEANIEAASYALKEKEVERSELDTEIKTKEEAIARFRTQQLEVKKNDEYRALTHQIEQTEQDISDLEERGIELLIEIDETSETFQVEKNHDRSKDRRREKTDYLTRRTRRKSNSFY